MTSLSRSERVAFRAEVDRLRGDWRRLPGDHHRTVVEAITAMDAATGWRLLGGMTDWTAQRYGGSPSIVWWGQISRRILGVGDDSLQAAVTQDEVVNVVRKTLDVVDEYLALPSVAATWTATRVVPEGAAQDSIDFLRLFGSIEKRGAAFVRPGVASQAAFVYGADRATGGQLLHGFDRWLHANGLVRGEQKGWMDCFGNLGECDWPLTAIRRFLYERPAVFQLVPS